MVGINIKIYECNSAISELKSLKSKMVFKAPPSTVGGGKTVNEFENMAETYDRLGNHLLQLVTNTIALLEDVRDSYIASDTKIVNTIAP